MRFLELELKNYYQKVYMDVGGVYADNRHALIIGGTGSGKSNGAMYMVENMLNNNTSVITIDTTKALTKNNIPQKFLSRNEYRIRYIDVRTEGLGINLLKKRMVDVNGRYVSESNDDVALRIMSLFGNTLSFGAKQKDTLYSAVISALEEDFFDIPENSKYYHYALDEYENDNRGLNCIWYALEKENTDVSKALLKRLTRNIGGYLYTDKVIDWNEILYGFPTMTIFELDGIESDDANKLISELILKELWYYVKLNGSNNRPFILLLDECQKLKLKGESAITDILTLGRKFGFGLWLCTQVVTSERIKTVLAEMSMASIKIIFKPSDTEKKYISKIFNIENIDDLNMLNKGDCIAIGKFVDECGNELKINQQTIHFPNLYNDIE